MKLPRDIGGKELARLLREVGYKVGTLDVILRD